MQYIHVKNLQKYHPGYKDRTLQWAKIYFKVVQGDPDCELITNEIDWARLIKFILLELEAQRPIPVNEGYLAKKGFDLKKRPISQTIDMLHNFIEVLHSNDDMPTDTRHVDKDKEEDKDKDKEDKSIVTFPFESIWLNYPKRVGRKEAERHFKASIKTEQDYIDIQTALKNYLESERVAKGFVQNGATWFGNWRDWLTFKETLCPKCKSKGKYTSSTGYEGYCDCSAGIRAKASGVKLR